MYSIFWGVVLWFVQSHVVGWKMYVYIVQRLGLGLHATTAPLHDCEKDCQAGRLPCTHSQGPQLTINITHGASIRDGARLA